MSTFEHRIDLSPGARQAVLEAQRYAMEQQAGVLTPEHLLLGLLKDARVQGIIEYAGADPSELDERVRMEIHRTQVQGQRGPVRSLTATPGFDRAVDRAMRAAINAGRSHVEVEHLLVSLFQEPDSSVYHCLAQSGLDKLGITSALSQPDAMQGGAGPDVGNEGAARPTALSQFAVDLNARAKEGKIDPLIGRETEIARVMQIMCRRRKNNPVLVGDPGVGKTALAEGLAWRIVNDRVPEALKSIRIHALDMGSLVAGTRFRGDFEARLKAVLKEVRQNPDIALFIDEIHTMIGAGGAGSGTMDASNILKPALANGSLRVIGATTFDEYRNVFEKDAALARRFRKVDVVEPSVIDAVAILDGLRPGLETHHGVVYTPEALSAAVHLSVKHLPNRLLPDKAIDLIDEAGAARRLQPDPIKGKTIDAIDLAAIVAQMAGVPADNVSSDDRAAIAALEPSLQSSVFGQDEAIKRLVAAIKTARAGLNGGNRPLGSFLFVGPTGVGKTEVTRLLAKTMNVPLLRFDMSEYMEAHAVARLIGAPPGYVGHDKGGLLTEGVTKNPYAVLLLDEIEKAHPDLHNVLLQVMDHGTLTDTNGRKAHFENVVVVMTTNAGAQHAARRSVGFVEQNHTSDGDEAVRRAFSPEFRNRIDAIVRFQPLNRESILRVVNKNLDELAASLKGKGVLLDVDAAARDWLAKEGFDPQMGARPMARVIQNHLKAPLADALLFGPLLAGGTAHVSVAEQELVLRYTPCLPASAAAPAPEAVVL